MPYPRPKPPPGGVKANYPGFIAPALATSIGKVPSGDRWLHEVAHPGIWVEPSLLAEIEYRAKSAEGKVRHPFFKGIRGDL